MLSEKQQFLSLVWPTLYPLSTSFNASMLAITPAIVESGLKMLLFYMYSTLVWLKLLQLFLDVKKMKVKDNQHQVHMDLWAWEAKNEWVFLAWHHVMSCCSGNSTKFFKDNPWTFIILIFPIAVPILHFAEDHQLYGHHGDNITSLIGMKSLDQSFL